MSKFQKRQQTFPITFNGFPGHFIMNTCRFAQKLLKGENPSGDFPIPFINKSDDGCYANFKCKKMADKVQELVDDVVTHDFPDFCNLRLLDNVIHHSIDAEDEGHLIYYIEENTIFILHPEKGFAERTIEKMTQMLDKYMIPHPVVLVSDLFESCSIKLTQEELLMISCGMQTFLKPIFAKEAQFMKAFSRTLTRIVTKQVKCTGIDFYDVKDVCKEIDIKGVYFYITPEYVELSGLPFNVKSFSEILKNRLKDVPSQAREVSRK
jgi:hypothetical protein